jgi:hypothetical protein
MKAHGSNSRYRATVLYNLQSRETRRQLRLRSFLILKQIALASLLLARELNIPRAQSAEASRARPFVSSPPVRRGVIAIVFSDPPMVVELTTELRAYPPRGWKTREKEGREGAVARSPLDPRAYHNYPRHYRHEYSWLHLAAGREKERKKRPGWPVESDIYIVNSPRATPDKIDRER